jgi:hypothetical protein
MTQDDYFSVNNCGTTKLNTCAGNYRAIKGEDSCPNPWYDDPNNSSFGK